MINQVRYPDIIAQKEPGNDGSWINLDNAKIEDIEKVASCSLKGYQKPAPLVLGGFDFNIPKSAKIVRVIIEYNVFKQTTQALMPLGAPVFRIGDVEKKSNTSTYIFPRDLEAVFEEGDLDLTPEEANGDGFAIEMDIPANGSDNEGEVYFDHVRVKIEYDYPRYAISSEEGSKFKNAEEPLEAIAGKDFSYSVAFENANGAIEERQEVKINISPELDIVKCEFKAGDSEGKDTDNGPVDEFDEENLIWYPSVRGKGSSQATFTLKSDAEGNYTIYAFNELSGPTPMCHVKVHPEGYELPGSEEAAAEEPVVEEPVVEEVSEETHFFSDETAIKIENVSMEFELPTEKVDNIKEYAIRWFKRDLPPKNYFKALNNVSFEIKKGERVGLIGFNGAGKSTLLKVLAGVYKPTSGKTEVNGKVAPLLELGAGFDHNYNGRENIFLNGSILGYSKKFLEDKYDEIVEFSELEKFMEVPIKNYSSGMQAKLGFAVATLVNPEILILDEVLSVGDVKFQKKSGDKIKSMMASGTTVLLVSHSISKIRELCTRAIWLDHGNLIMDGEVNKVCDAYIEASRGATPDQLKNLEIR